MAAPRALTGATTTMLLDGIDMHEYGMTVISVSNPIPAPIESMVQIYGRDGALDYSRSMSVRTIMIEGEIIADSHSGLLTYIDEINKIIRLRENGNPIKLRFTDQADRYWTVRIQSSDMVYKGLKSRGRIMSYSIRFVCAKPYSEHVDMSYFYKRLSTHNALSISNFGTLKTPINISLTNTHSTNLIELSSNYNDTYRSAWATLSNSSRAYVTASYLYGGYSTRFTQASAGAYSAAINLDSAITPGSDCCISCYVKYSGTDLNLLFRSGSNIVSQATVNTTYGEWGLVYLYVDGNDTSGETVFTLELTSDSSPDDTYFDVAGTFAYNLSSRYDSVGDIPIPYSYDISNVVNPKINMFRGINIFPYKNGDPLTNWIDDYNILSVTKDPIGNENVLYVQSKINGEVAFSEYIYVKSGARYHVGLERYVRQFTGNYISIYVFFYLENGDAIETEYISDEINTINVAYATENYTVSAPSGAVYMRLVIYNNNAQFKMCVKNIMVSVETVVDEDYPDYEEPSTQTQQYTGSIQPGDSLSIDNENGYARYESYDDGTTENAMSGFTGDQLELSPGTNYLRLTDARYGVSEDPETLSIGNLGVLYSFRRRYL